MAGPEALLTRHVLSWLRKRPGSYTVKVAGGPHQARGLPDVLHLEGGHLWAIELKAPKGRATALQMLALERLEVSGATAAVVRSIPELQALFEEPAHGEE
jgi:Holliday junction resolvase